MKGRLYALLTVAALLMVTLPVAAAEPPSLSTLEPGGFRDIEQDLTINVVFVGYEPGAGSMDIDETAFLAELPSTYRAINRHPSIYMGNEFLGLTFNYNYNLIYANESFEDAFFGYLESIADPMPLTLYQDWHNTQAARSLDVTSNNWIDAPSVEQWLADSAGPMLGVDTAQYTVFFVN